MWDIIENVKRLTSEEKFGQYEKDLQAKEKLLWVLCEYWVTHCEQSIGQKVDFATRWQVRGGHVPILVHWGVNRHTVDKSGGLSVIIPKTNE